MRDTIDMAREAGFFPEEDFEYERLELFEALVRADERARAVRENAYVQAEREACASLCDVLAVHPEYASDITKLAAAAIRARSQK